MSARTGSALPPTRCDRVVEMRLVVIEDHEGSGLELGDLPRDLRTDPSATTGDEHTLAVQEIPHGSEVDAHRLAAE